MKEYKKRRVRSGFTMVELMAAVPSVVVGFLAALWLAPRLEAALLAVMLAAVVLPLAVVFALTLWRLVPASTRQKLPEGSELVLLLAAGGFIVIAVASLADPIEARLFGGDFQRFLFTEWGLRYDQRNAIVVGLEDRILGIGAGQMNRVAFSHKAHEGRGDRLDAARPWE